MISGGKMKFKRQRHKQHELSGIEAQRLAHEIACAPIVFQVSRLMRKFGILQMLSDAGGGLTLSEVAQQAHLSRYAAQVLLESSLTIGTVACTDGYYTLTKVGWFVLNDRMVGVNMDFNHDVNYLGLYRLEEALREERPAGLEVFGRWPTIYEGLSQLPPDVQRSWFAFDHFYSDHSFAEALDIVFARPPRRLLDVGGNTGRFAMQCTDYNDAVEVTVMDLAQQLDLLRRQTASYAHANRIHMLPANLLDERTCFPSGFDVIWMSQFLDCFSETEVVSILTRAAKAMTSNTRLYIMETCWDRQQFETAAYCLTQLSVYFTAMANGNSKFFHSADLLRCIETAGLKAEQIHDHIGLGHSIIVCKKAITE